MSALVLKKMPTLPRNGLTKVQRQPGPPPITVVLFGVAAPVSSAPLLVQPGPTTYFPSPGAPPPLPLRRRATSGPQTFVLMAATRALVLPSAAVLKQNERPPN